MRFVVLALITAVAACGDDPALDDPAAAVAFPDPRLDVEFDWNPFDAPRELLGVDGDDRFGERPLRGRGSYELDVTSGEARIALRLDQGSSTAGHTIEVVFGQEMALYPLGTRYLHVDWTDVKAPTSRREPRDETFVPLANVLTAPNGERYLGHDEATFREGYTEMVEMDLDAATGAFRASIFMRFSLFPQEEGVRQPTLMFVAHVEGYLRVYCRVGDRRAAQLRPNWVDPYEPGECAEVFDMVRATPDDPDAPAPPYLLYPE